MRIALIVLCAAALAFIALLLFPGDVGPPAHSLAHIDIADSEEERVAGLSNRAVPEDYGMLFVFPTEGSYGFWMKDTLAPLDVVWLARDGRILGITHNAAPETYPQVFYPPAPVRYVLEVRGGTAVTRGWATSTVLSLPLPN